MRQYPNFERGLIAVGFFVLVSVLASAGPAAAQATFELVHSSTWVNGASPWAALAR